MWVYGLLGICVGLKVLQTIGEISLSANETWSLDLSEYFEGEYLDYFLKPSPFCQIHKSLPYTEVFSFASPASNKKLGPMFSTKRGTFFVLYEGKSIELWRHGEWGVEREWEIVVEGPVEDIWASFDGFGEMRLLYWIGSGENIGIYVLNPSVSPSYSTHLSEISLSTDSLVSGCSDFYIGTFLAGAFSLYSLSPPFYNTTTLETSCPVQGTILQLHCHSLPSLLTPQGLLQWVYPCQDTNFYPWEVEILPQVFRLKGNAMAYRGKSTLVVDWAQRGVILQDSVSLYYVTEKRELVGTYVDIHKDSWLVLIDLSAKRKPRLLGRFPSEDSLQIIWLSEDDDYFEFISIGESTMRLYRVFAPALSLQVRGQSYEGQICAVELKHRDIATCLNFTVSALPFPDSTLLYQRGLTKQIKPYSQLKTTIPLQRDLTSVKVPISHLLSGPILDKSFQPDHISTGVTVSVVNYLNARERSTDIEEIKQYMQHCRGGGLIYNSVSSYELGFLSGPRASLSGYAFTNSTKCVAHYPYAVIYTVIEGELASFLYPSNIESRRNSSFAGNCKAQLTSTLVVYWFSEQVLVQFLGNGSWVDLQRTSVLDLWAERGTVLILTEGRVEMWIYRVGRIDREKIWEIEAKGRFLARSNDYLVIYFEPNRVNFYKFRNVWDIEYVKSVLLEPSCVFEGFEVKGNWIIALCTSFLSVLNTQLPQRDTCVAHLPINSTSLLLAHNSYLLYQVTYADPSFLLVPIFYFDPFDPSESLDIRIASRAYLEDTVGTGELVVVSTVGETGSVSVSITLTNAGAFPLVNTSWSGAVVEVEWTSTLQLPLDTLFAGSALVYSSSHPNLLQCTQFITEMSTFYIGEALYRPSYAPESQLYCAILNLNKSGVSLEIVSYQCINQTCHKASRRSFTASQFDTSFFTSCEVLLEDKDRVLLGVLGSNQIGTIIKRELMIFAYDLDSKSMEIVYRGGLSTSKSRFLALNTSTQYDIFSFGSGLDVLHVSLSSSGFHTERKTLLAELTEEVGTVSAYWTETSWQVYVLTVSGRVFEYLLGSTPSLLREISTAHIDFRGSVENILIGRSLVSMKHMQLDIYRLPSIQFLRTIPIPEVWALPQYWPVVQRFPPLLVFKLYKEDKQIVLDLEAPANSVLRAELAYSFFRFMNAHRGYAYSLSSENAMFCFNPPLLVIPKETVKSAEEIGEISLSATNMQGKVELRGLRVRRYSRWEGGYMVLSCTAAGVLLVLVAFWLLRRVRTKSAQREIELKQLTTGQSSNNEG